VFGTTNSILYPKEHQYNEPCYSEHILPVPWVFAMSLIKISSTAFYHSPENYKIMTKFLYYIQIWTWIHVQYCLATIERNISCFFVVLVINCHWFERLHTIIYKKNKQYIFTSLFCSQHNSILCLKPIEPIIFTALLIHWYQLFFQSCLILHVWPCFI